MTKTTDGDLTTVLSSHFMYAGTLGQLVIIKVVTFIAVVFIRARSGFIKFFLTEIKLQIGSV